ncbi:MAG: DNA primase [Actinomycetota bacterium]
MPRRIAQDDIEELRRRADLAEVVSGYLQLKKAGRVFKGLCCFHQEKTPSFVVDPEKGLYYCHGCGAGGDVFSFLRQLETMTFSEAAERLADRFGMTLRYEGAAERDDGSSRRALLAACRAAASFFAESLQRSGAGASARAYLERRGFSAEDARTWGLGFGPASREVLHRHLLARGVTSKHSVDAGVVLVTDAGEHLDRFRGRLIFPIADVAGDVVGFGARALGDEQPKYMNSPETPIYHKAKILYGLDRAKSAMVRTGLGVVTEGYTDVIALHKAGVTNAVATCGTALGEEHFATIKRFCDRVILAFDADAAGALASERGFGIHARTGLEVLVAPLPAGKDPADVATSDGADAVAAMLQEAVPLIRFVLEAGVSRHRLDTPEGKAAAARAAVEKLAWEPNAVTRTQYAFWLARRIGVEPFVVESLMREISAARRGDDPEPPRKAVRLPGRVRLEREALALLLNSPSARADAAPWLTPDHITEPRYRLLLEAVLASPADAGQGSILDRLPDDESRRLAAELALMPRSEDDPSKVFLRLQELWLERKRETLRATLNRLAPEADTDDELWRELLRLEQELRGIRERIEVG